MPRALAIVHQPDAGPGVFTAAAGESGWELAEWPVSEGSPPPDDPAGFDAVLSFGGSAHPDERHPWLDDEIRVLGDLVSCGIPLLAVCLGAQLLARAAGGNAQRAPRPEIGWHDVRVNAVDDPVVGPLAPRFSAFGWHAYECTLPPDGAVGLASSDLCLQAFRVGRRAWGIQFHAEVTRADAFGWIDDYASDPDAVAAGVDPVALRAATEPRIAAWNELGRDLCRRFLAEAASGPVVERAP